jgi:hypothetical protein
MGPSLPLTRVVALIGGLALIAAFFMPWFASQGLLLSGQFLHTFLAGASAADLRRFLPASSPAEVQMLRLLVDLFPVSGAIAAIVTVATHVRAKTAGAVVTAIAGLVPLAAWAIGVNRLPPGSSSEIGLWLIALGSIAIVAAAAAELIWRPAPTVARPPL